MTLVLDEAGEGWSGIVIFRYGLASQKEIECKWFWNF
jgi:hypothetical protein